MTYERGLRGSTDRISRIHGKLARGPSGPDFAFANDEQAVARRKSAFSFPLAGRARLFLSRLRERCHDAKRRETDRGPAMFPYPSARAESLHSDRALARFGVRFASTFPASGKGKRRAIAGDTFPASGGGPSAGVRV